MNTKMMACLILELSKKDVANTFAVRALQQLLIEKGIFTQEEWDLKIESISNEYHDAVGENCTSISKSLLESVKDETS